MSSLRDIRRQIRSIGNIKKITDAMERVAASHLRRAQAKAEKSRPYVTKMKELVEKFALTDVSHPLLEQREVKKTGIVVLAGDKGLCGAYNSNVFSTVDKLLKKYTQDNVELILIGRKAQEHYRRRKWKIRHQMAAAEGKIHFKEIKEFSDHLVDWFLTGEFDEIWIVYTHYINAMSRQVYTEKFLNIEKSKIEKQQHVNLNYIIEPNPEELLAELLPRYCLTRIQTAFNEAAASELGARMMAMRMASKNSAEMIESLTLTRNKIRQASITREMIEITSGAEGLK